MNEELSDEGIDHICKMIVLAEINSKETGRTIVECSREILKATQLLMKLGNMGFDVKEFLRGSGIDGQG